MDVVAEKPVPVIQAADLSPIVVDLGKKPRKQVRRLCRGEGKLVDEVGLVIEELRASGSLAPNAQPVILIVRQKPRRSNLLWPLGS